MNDADIEMHGMIREANIMARVEKKHGVCFHGSLMHLTCEKCGKTFKSEEQWIDAINELRMEWC